MDEKRTQIEKQYHKRVRQLILILILPEIAAWALMFFGARQQREDGSSLLMFGAFLLFIAVAAIWYIGNRSAAKNRLNALDALEQECAVNPELDADAVSLPGEKGTTSLLVMGYPSDTVYQLISGEREYHFVRLGWGGLDAKSYDRILPPDLSDAEIRAAMEKGFSVPKAEVESLEMTMKQCVSTQIPNDGIFTLRSGGKKRKFIVLRPEEPTTPEALRAFFSDVSDRLTFDTARYEKEKAIRNEIRELSEDPEQANPAVVKKLKPLAIVLAVLPWLCWGVWRYLGVPYRPFAALQLLLALLPAVLLIAFPKIFSVSSAMKLSVHDTDARPGTVDLSTTLMAAMIPLTLSSLVDFNIQNWILLVVELAVFSLVLAWLFTRDSKGIRRIWLVRLLLTLLLMMFGSGVLIQTNFLLDRSEPTPTSKQILDKHISSGRSTSYILEFSEKGESFSLDVEPQLYDRVERGDTVLIVKNKGGLGIEYAEVWTADEWNSRY